ncbi:nuclear protein UL24 [Cercopithecine alphaherpesvirus 2]|uniref:Nonglycosylated membrane-associated protein n=1 Tax=Cercopithecine alphaherpesvirus 2 TaxID=10317 RepID=Q5Y0S9_9ALPH|nr:nuclear protein UL24 [Cercopithecine alphaherpesvirus 2]AAU88089.1 nonglycosylated membrane-associated protein [Cercopithecine alphaherpesvirus 2]
MARRTGDPIERRRILLAGVRSHVRFYRALAGEIREFTATRVCGSLLTLLNKSLQGRSVFEATRITLICEVDLGARRPDCLCVFEFANDVTLGGVCVIIELKTCRFISSGETASKREQRATGLSQLRDSVKLVQALVAPGHRTLYLCPVLLFVSQKTLRVSRATRLLPQRITGDVVATVRTLQGLSTYAVPLAATKTRRGRPGARRPRVRRRVRGGGTGPPVPAEPAAPERPPAPRASTGRGGGVLQKIAALFCVPVSRPE